MPVRIAVNCPRIARHLFLQPRNLGENIYIASASPNPPAAGPTAVVDGWASEQQDYNYANNTCAAGKQCGHYTQIVWAATTEVGCAVATCASAEWQHKKAVCNYRPGGNVTRHRPY